VIFRRRRPPQETPEQIEARIAARYEEIARGPTKEWAQSFIWRDFAMEIAKSGALQRQNEALTAECGRLQRERPPFWRAAFGLGVRKVPDLNAELTARAGAALTENAQLRQKVQRLKEDIAALKSPAAPSADPVP
jgi:hypothetical protein